MLLRALENHEIVPVGAVESRQVDVRVIAATDLRLGEAVTAGNFRAPLLHRLAGYTIRLPSLAARRDDVGRLLFFFLASKLAETGAVSGSSKPLGDKPESPWPPAKVVARLGRYDWPGNVRELRNVAHWLVIAGQDVSAHELGVRLEEVLEGSAVHVLPGSVEPRCAEKSRVGVGRRLLRKPSEVGEEELRDALKAHRFKLSATAEALGVSRANLYRLIDECPTIRKAADLGRDEVEETLRRSEGDLEAAAAELEVSLRGLKRRMTALSLPRS
jgi:two-component system nitrogen regulation response regulator GlnG